MQTTDALHHEPERVLAQIVGLAPPQRLGLSLGLQSHWRKVRKVFRLKYLIRQFDPRLYRDLFILRTGTARHIRNMLASLQEYERLYDEGRPIVKNDISRMLPLYVALQLIADREPNENIQLVDIGCSYGFHALYDRVAFNVVVNNDRQTKYTDNVISPFLDVFGQLVGFDSLGSLAYSRFTYLGCDPFAPSAENDDDIAWFEANSTFASTEDVDVFQACLSAASHANNSILRMPAKNLAEKHFSASQPVVIQHSCSWHQLDASNRDCIRELLNLVSHKTPTYEVGLMPISPNRLLLFVRQFEMGVHAVILRAVWHEQSNSLEVLHQNH